MSPSFSPTRGGIATKRRRRGRILIGVSSSSTVDNDHSEASFFQPSAPPASMTFHRDSSSSSAPRPPGETLPYDSATASWISGSTVGDSPSASSLDHSQQHLAPHANRTISATDSTLSALSETQQQPQLHSPLSSASLPSPPSTEGSAPPRKHAAPFSHHLSTFLKGKLASCLAYFLTFPLLYLFGRGLRKSLYLTPSAQRLSEAESAMVRLKSGFSQSAAAENLLAQTRNRPEIAEFLESNPIQWGPYAETRTINLATSNKEEAGAHAPLFPRGTPDIDITQNVPRIHDYLQAPAAAADSSRHLHGAGNAQQQQRADDNNPPLNMVLFYADDWTMQVLGALNPHVQTPHIDGLASRGMLFTRNCVTTSICWISRNTLATGVYAAVHQTVELKGTAMFNQTVPWLETLYPLLKRHGYYTGLVGKWHALKPKDFMPHTFDRIKNYYNKHWFIRNGKRRHVTDLNREDALEFLQTRPKDRPFSLTVSFFATHAWEGVDPPYQPMPESMKLYQNRTIPRPKTATPQHWKDLPWFFTEKNMGRQRWMGRFDTPENYQDQIRNLYRMATEVDAAVGTIIEELKDQGVYDNTLLIFTTDNGNLHGEHGLAEKWYPFEESIRVPLVIQDPRMPAAARGTRNDDLTLSVDLAPTLLAAAQIPVPTFMQGRDLAQLYLHPTETRRTWRQDFFYEWNQGNAVTAEGHHALSRNTPAVFALIRKDYKYFYWPKSGYEQLFQIEQDPFEESDVCNATSQTTRQALFLMKARYGFLKKWAQSGNPV